MKFCTTVNLSCVRGSESPARGSSRKHSRKGTANHTTRKLRGSGADFKSILMSCDKLTWYKILSGGAQYGLLFSCVCLVNAGLGKDVVSNSEEMKFVKKRCARTRNKLKLWISEQMISTSLPWRSVWEDHSSNRCRGSLHAWPLQWPSQYAVRQFLEEHVLGGYMVGPAGQVGQVYMKPSTSWQVDRMVTHTSQLWRPVWVCFAYCGEYDQRLVPVWWLWWKTPNHLQRDNGRVGQRRGEMWNASRDSWQGSVLPNARWSCIAVRTASAKDWEAPGLQLAAWCHGALLGGWCWNEASSVHWPGWQGSGSNTGALNSRWWI